MPDLTGFVGLFTIGGIYAVARGVGEYFESKNHEKNISVMDDAMFDTMPENELQANILITGEYDKANNKIIDGKREYNLINTDDYFATYVPSSKIKTHSSDVFKVDNQLYANVRALNHPKLAHLPPKTVGIMSKHAYLLAKKKSVSFSIIGGIACTVAYGLNEYHERESRRIMGDKIMDDIL